MLSSFKETILNVQNVNINLFSNGGYEAVSEVDEEDFWLLEIENYGSTLGFQIRKRTSPFRNALIIGVTFIILVVIFAFVLHGLTKAGKSHLNVVNSALSLANDVSAEEGSRFIQMGDDRFPDIDTEPVVGDDMVLDLQLQWLKNEEIVVTKLLEYMQSQQQEEPNNSEQIKVLQSRLEEQVLQKEALLREKGKYVAG